MALRRALLFASGGRYVLVGLNLLTTACIARLLAPKEAGIAVLGVAVLGIAEALRELGSVVYLVQQEDLTTEKIRTVFTVNLCATLTLAALLPVAGVVLAHLYKLPGLTTFMQIAALGFLLAPFHHPIQALLNRDLAFDALAAMDITTSLSASICSVGLLLLGMSYLAIAWAGVASGVCYTVVGLVIQRDLSIYQPCLREWRSVVAFGVCGSATAVLNKATDSLYYLVLGKLLNARSVALCQRALLLSQFPERVMLAAVGMVALSAFSGRARGGHSLKVAYLNAIEHLSAVHWPAMILLCTVAGPFVTLMLGPQWREAVPLIQIYSMALLFSFPNALSYPTLVASGAIRHTTPLAFIQMLITLLVAGITGRYGLRHVALGMFISTPCGVGFSVYLVRAHLGFTWLEFFIAVRKSAVCAFLSGAGPFLVSLNYGWSAAISLQPAVIAVGLSGIGWIGGLWLTDHPLLREFARVKNVMNRYQIGVKLAGWIRSN